MGRNKKCFLFRCFHYWIIIMILGKRMIVIYVYIDQVPLETRPLSHTSVSMERTGLIGLEKWVSKFFIGQYLICLRHHQIQTIYSTTVDLEQRGLDKQFFLYCTFYILFLFICCKVHVCLKLFWWWWWIKICCRKCTQPWSPYPTAASSPEWEWLHYLCWEESALSSNQVHHHRFVTVASIV